MKYLIKLKPLAPYFFGGENTFRIGEDNPYYIRSLKTPPQTSFIGTLRYTLLACSGLLNTSGKYSNPKVVTDLIGKSSYQPGKPNQSFGAIQSVSPMFLTDSQGEKYIRLPLNHSYKASSIRYTPLTFSNKEAETSHGKMKLPVDFDAKHTVDSEYVRISDGKVFPNEDCPLFQSQEQVGINIEKSKKAFFKREFITLHPDFCFAWYAEIDYDFDDKPIICYMGRDKSPFEMTFHKDSGDIVKEVEKLPCKSDMEFYYALSDLVLNEPISYKDKGFAMVKLASSRPLTSDFKDANGKDSNGQMNLHKGTQQLQIIRAGSAFYWKNEICSPDGFGCNVLVKLGGTQK